MVRLLPERQGVKVLGRGFNPTMVRLLPSSRTSAFSTLPVSIPQWCDCCTCNPFPSCRFLSVSIPQWCDCCSLASASHSRSRSFQSHNGAIAARAMFRQPTSMVAFQSHNGAIAACIACISLGTPSAVSIPQWCDCCCKVNATRLSWFTRFNPTMVRLLHFFRVQAHQEDESFNPTMVRLLRQRKSGKIGDKICFNPTMVRLLQIWCWRLRC